MISSMDILLDTLTAVGDWMAMVDVLPTLPFVPVPEHNNGIVSVHDGV